jgi:hypothetical protein
MIIFRSFKPIVLSRNLQLSYKPTYSQLFTTQHLKMPLIVPGINSGGANSKTDEWMNKLVGKKLGDGSSDATVCSDLPVILSYLSREMLMAYIDFRED